MNIIIIKVMWTLMISKPFPVIFLLNLTVLSLIRRYLQNSDFVLPKLARKKPNAQQSIRTMRILQWESILVDEYGGWGHLPSTFRKCPLKSLQRCLP